MRGVCTLEGSEEHARAKAQRRQELDGIRTRFRMRMAFFGDLAREMVLVNPETVLLASLARERDSRL